MRTIPEATELPAVMGRVVRVVNSPLEADGSGGDIDCIVGGLDPRWPLRLQGWRLCQCFHYDVTGWYWVLEREGEVVAVDALDDPQGIGKYGFPTSEFVSAEAAERSGAPAIAAYLTAKRLRKGITEQDEWRRIAALAAIDRSAYRLWLEPTFGGATAAALDQAISADSKPHDALWRRARVIQNLRRVRSPRRAIRLLGLSVARVVARIARPTGFVVVVAGPDGSGKSTLADALPDACTKLFRRTRRIHWRPGILPRPGAVAGRPEADSTDPHGRPPRGTLASVFLLFYYWLDFLIGELIRVRPARVRSTLVVWERGWWDIAADPARYRLRVSRRVVTLLGHMLPQPDLVLSLHAAPDVLFTRKPELPHDELQRQLEAWTQVVPRGVRRTRIDVSASAFDVINAARSSIVSSLEDRAAARLSGGWTGLPRRRDPRWILPRGPRAAARSGLFLYQPVTWRGLAGWTAANALSSLGAFRSLPRGPAPARAVREAIAPLLPRGGTIAAMRIRAGRYVALVLDGDGRPHAVAKVGGNQGDAAVLEAEARALMDLGPLLPAPLRAPRVLDVGDGVVFLEAVEWSPRRRPWFLPPEVAAALGGFFAKGGGKSRGLGHGDFAPWNLLSTRSGEWYLVDWEQASDDAPALFDLFHFLTQSHALLGRPRERALLEGIQGQGWVNAAVEAYCERAELDRAVVAPSFAAYLTESKRSLDLSTADGRAAYEARCALLDGLRATT